MACRQIETENGNGLQTNRSGECQWFADKEKRRMIMACRQIETENGNGLQTKRSGEW